VLNLGSHVLMKNSLTKKAAVGLTDVASRLAISCFKLYGFWESLQGAPSTVEVIKTDLVLLSNILQDLSAKGNLALSVSMALKSCQAKIEVNSSAYHRQIVRDSY